MKAGKLPDRPPDRMWGGPGSGGPCAVCGKTIGTEGVEIELQFMSDEGPHTATYHVHTQCFAAWDNGRRRGGSNGRSLPQGGDGGMMPSRERYTTNQGKRS